MVCGRCRPPWCWRARAQVFAVLLLFLWQRGTGVTPCAERRGHSWRRHGRQPPDLCRCSRPHRDHSGAIIARSSRRSRRQARHSIDFSMRARASSSGPVARSERRRCQFLVQPFKTWNVTQSYACSCRQGSPFCDEVLERERSWFWVLGRHKASNCTARCCCRSSLCRVHAVACRQRR